MESPRIWTRAELERDAQVALDDFKQKRLEEPVGLWGQEYDLAVAEVTALLEGHRITDPANAGADQIVAALDAGLLDALRYLAGPPVSADDLKVLADVSLAKSKLRSDPGAGERIRDVVAVALDAKRFPWIGESRAPTPTELDVAVKMTAVLMTQQRLATKRRNESKTDQEDRVHRYLTKLGFREQRAPQYVRTLGDGPEEGRFFKETTLGSRKADVTVRLHDGRLLALECKVSNSYINSVKRVNNDAAVKAQIWRQEFGTNQIVPGAVLSGAYRVSNLLQAQRSSLVLYWSHRLKPLGAFIFATRTPPA